MFSVGALTRCPHSPPTRCPHSPPQGLGALTIGALTSRGGALTGCPHFPKAPPCRRRVVVASSHRAVVSSVCASILTASILTASILTRVLIPGPQCWSSRRRVAVPAPILTAILTARSSPLVAASSPRRRRVYRYPRRSLGESMRRCSDWEGLGGCSEARVVVASSSPPRRLVSRGQEPLRKLVKTAGATPGATPAHSRRVVPASSPRCRVAAYSPLRPRVRAVLHACSSSSRRASSGSHLASCTRVRRSKRPGKTHRDQYHESLRDVGGLYLAGSGQRQQ